MLQDTPMPVRDYFTFCLSPVDPVKLHLSKALHEVRNAPHAAAPAETCQLHSELGNELCLYSLS